MYVLNFRKVIIELINIIHKIVQIKGNIILQISVFNFVVSFFLFFFFVSFVR